MNYDCYFSSNKLLKSILEEIRETIKDKHPSGITQELFASEPGISREQLSRLLNGEYKQRYFPKLFVSDVSRVAYGGIMKIADSMLTTFINVDEQSEIPIFQRSYEWKEENVIKLLDDIISIAQNEKRTCHFIGSIIYKNEESNDGIRIRTIIDGQQRLTTISLLLLALEDYQLEKNASDNSALKQIRRYQYNDTDNESLKVKLKHNGDDFMAYFNLVTDRQTANNYSNNNCIINYNIILRELKKRNVEPIVYVRGIEKLKIVDILIEKEDDAESIFETVNTTGLDLTSTEIIKNYILMTVPASHQQNLYITHWYPMEKYFKTQKNGAAEFDLFFKYYLRSVVGGDVSDKKFFKDFKGYVENNSQSRDTEDIITNELPIYFENYKLWKDTRNWSRDKLSRQLYYLKLAKNDVFLPVVLKILKIVKIAENDFNNSQDENQKAKKQIFEKKKEAAIKILSSIDSYFTRRMLCGFESKLFGKAWIKMLAKIDDELSYQKFITFYDEVEGTDQRMPNDNNVENATKSVDVYSRIKWLNCTLSRIEHSFNDDNTPEYHGSWTIEHIMPQTVYSPEELKELNKSDEEKEKLKWAEDLGDKWQYIHDKYMNTLGNLTLLGYKNNSAVQNYVFSVKRDLGKNSKNKEMGYAKSSIHITSMLKDYDLWGEAQILERASILATSINNIWPFYKK